MASTTAMTRPATRRFITPPCWCSLRCDTTPGAGEAITKLADDGPRTTEAPRGQHPLPARGGRGAHPRTLARGRLLPSPRGGNAGGELLDRDPAAERHSAPPHGPQRERHRPGRADPA